MSKTCMTYIRVVSLTCASFTSKKYSFNDLNNCLKLKWLQRN